MNLKLADGGLQLGDAVTAIHNIVIQVSPTTGNITISQLTGNLLLEIPNAGIADYADDAAAAVAGIGVGTLYRTGSTLKIRIA